MLPSSECDQWALFAANRGAVIAALRRGACDAILPVARTFPDDVGEFLHQHQVFDQFGTFPDQRDRTSIPAFEARI